MNKRIATIFIMIGLYNTSQAQITIGSTTNSSGTITINQNGASASGTDSIAIGANSNSSGNAAIAIGQNSQSSGVHSISIAEEAKATANYAIAIGGLTNASADYAIALGEEAVASAKNAIAIGYQTQVSLENAIALGNESKVTQYNQVDSSYTIAGTTYEIKGTTDDNPSVLSVGSEWQQRQIQNVAAGKISADSTDAINGSQLYAVIRAIEAQALNTAPETLQKLQQQVENNKKEIHRRFERAAKGIASVAAMVSIPTPATPGKATMGVGIGGYDGKKAIAIGGSRYFHNGIAIKGTLATGMGRSASTYNAGVSYTW